MLGERDDGAIAVSVAAPPVDGRANAALVAFLAEQLGLPKRAVTVVGGHASRDKLVEIDGLDASEVRSRLFLPG